MNGNEPDKSTVHRSGRPMRKSHKKSRTGCSNCKQRRIKCDEVKPICGYCHRQFIPCDITPNLAFRERLPTPTAQLAPRKRGRPSKAWLLESRNAQSPEKSEDTEVAVSYLFPPTISENLYEWSVDDLELLFHYMSDPSFTQGNRQLWQEKVPRLAFLHHCVLHLLLAISALHRVRLEPEQHGRFKRLADGHLAIGIRQSMELLSRLSRDNCDAVYITACLACTCSFAQEPGPRHLLVVADGSEVPWFNLFRGVRLIVETMGLEAIFSGVLGPFGEPPSDTDLPRGIDKSRLEFIPWEEPLHKVSELISATAVSHLDVCHRMFESLLYCFRETFGTSADPASDTVGAFETIMIWLYRMEDEFVHCLLQNEPAALVLLAHFALLLQTLEYCWFMEGWATHISESIVQILDPSYRQWLQWPREQIHMLIGRRNRLSV